MTVLTATHSYDPRVTRGRYRALVQRSYGSAGSLRLADASGTLARFDISKRGGASPAQLFDYTGETPLILLADDGADAAVELTRIGSLQ